MDVSETVAAVIVTIAVFTLISASVEDLRTRTVRDGHWAVIGGSGAILNLFAFIEGGIFFGLTVSILSMTILYCILNGSERFGNARTAFIGTVIALTVVSYVLAPSDSFRYAALSVPIFSGMFVLMYYAGLLRGGADAKCMVSLAIAFPAYPIFYKYPLIKITDGISSVIFSFPLAILFLALLITLTVAVPLFLINLKRGNIGKNMFSGYVTDIAAAKNSHVWPMHDVLDGKLIKISPSEDSTDIFERLEQQNEKNIWVTPMIPFMVPIAVSFAITAIFGNPIFLIL
ncbi:MAG: A24 family peptidase C-terminal domain-containing protein [Candidatus Methanomethylophilaceae archaeon]